MITTTKPLEIGPPAVTYPADGSVLPVHRFAWTPVALPPVRPQPDRLAGRRVLIIGSAAESAAAVAEVLRGYGAKAYCCTLDQDWSDEALAALKTLIGRLDGIIDLNLEDAYSLAQAAAWEEPFRLTIRVIQTFYDEWAEETDATRLFYMPVTYLDGQMGYSGSSEITQPLGGIWAGLAKSLPREIPNCHVRVLDLSPADRAHLGERIANELYNWGVFEVGYQNGVRYGLYAKHAPLGAPLRTLDETDTILISGGARGIGFALAKALAGNFGARVIVTGRSRLPQGTEPWLTMDEAAFRAYQFERLREAADAVAKVRRELEGMKAQRELYQHITSAQAAGLRIEYEACDFNSLQSVAALVDRLGASLTGVIHNAGIEETVRLNKKAVEACLATVRIKVGGFANLAQALAGRSLKFFCSVGSLSGRWGGMVGQLDYAAGNEGLARLGFWAAAAGILPVQTICWPTWENLGLITNFKAALKYASAVNVAEGIYHWQRDLLAGAPGECMYMGKVGKALVPMQIDGFLPSSIAKAPDIQRIYSQVFYKGEVRRFQLFRSVEAVCSVRRQSTSAIDDVLRNDRPMLPVSLLLEYALSLAEWVVPEGWQDLPLTAITDLEVNLGNLDFPTDTQGLPLEKTAEGRRDEDGNWVVSVTLTGQGGTVASMRLVHGADQAPLPVAIVEAGAAPQPVTLTTGAWAWRGQTFDLARWRRDGSGSLVGTVRPCTESDLWLVPHLPAVQLPSAHLENILRAAWALGGRKGAPQSLYIGRIDLADRRAEAADVALVGGDWYVRSRNQQTVLKLSDLTFKG
jgi:NAD(P)-dependent dehydrogenase (short-subunit alcohol dehydrogenase family)